MTPKDLIALLQDNIERTGIYVFIENDNNLYDISNDTYILFSADEKNRNQFRNKTAPLALVAKKNT